jgi:hypothetical protein
MAELALDTFRPLVGDPFVIRAADGHIDAVLTEATSLGEANGAPRAPFSLVWRGPLDAPLQQGLHEVEHAAFGPEVMFLVPIGRTAEGFDYQAIFS